MRCISLPLVLLDGLVLDGVLLDEEDVKFRASADVSLLRAPDSAADPWFPKSDPEIACSVPEEDWTLPEKRASLCCVVSEAAPAECEEPFWRCPCRGSRPGTMTDDGRDDEGEQL